MILVAEPPLQAEIMMSSSMIVSLMVGLPDWMMKTSFSRTLLRILTLVSPCREEKMVSQVNFATEVCRGRGRGRSRDDGRPRRASEPATDAGPTGTHIRELRELRLCRRHAQALTYLACENRAG